MLAAVVAEAGGRGQALPHLQGSGERSWSRAGVEARECDAALVIAGSSAGRGDFTSKVLERLGELLVHGVNIMPGKPVALGLARGKPVIGVPGYPVSAAVVADLFVRPTVAKLLGTLPAEPPREVEAHAQVPSRLGHEELVRRDAGPRAREAVAVPLGGRGGPSPRCAGGPRPDAHPGAPRGI
jgi:molybdopterin biosynthesis enzyme